MVAQLKHFTLLFDTIACMMGYENKASEWEGEVTGDSFLHQYPNELANWNNVTQNYNYSKHLRARQRHGIANWSLQLQLLWTAVIRTVHAMNSQLCVSQEKP